LEPVEKDEAFSWTAATVIMVVFSLLALITMALGIDPFSLLFNVALVYLPTLILLGSALFRRGKRSS
jgi:hypothetical protein